MEYVFGTKDKDEILKVKGAEHTDLTGYQQVVLETDLDKTTHDFRIVRKWDSAEDVEGNCYDWYIIDHHSSYVDTTKPVVEKTDEINANIGLTTADRELSPGEYVTYNGKMYHVTLPIPAGGMIAPGTNAEETTIATELNNI